MEALWATLLRTGSVEIPMGVGRVVAGLCGAVLFAGFTGLALAVTALEVVRGEETWQVVLNPLLWVFVAGFVLFGIIGIPSILALLAARPSLVLTPEGMAEYTGRTGHRTRRSFLSWSEIDDVRATFIPQRWPLPPTHLVTIILSPAAHDRRSADRGRARRTLDAVEARISGARSVSLRSGFRGGSRVLEALLCRAHRHFSPGRRGGTPGAPR